MLACLLACLLAEVCKQASNIYLFLAGKPGSLKGNSGFTTGGSYFGSIVGSCLSSSCIKGLVVITPFASLELGYCLILVSFILGNSLLFHSGIPRGFPSHTPLGVLFMVKIRPTNIPIKPKPPISNKLVQDKILRISISK